VAEAVGAGPHKGATGLSGMAGLTRSLADFLVLAPEELTEQALTAILDDIDEHGTTTLSNAPETPEARPDVERDLAILHGDLDMLGEKSGALGDGQELFLAKVDDVRRKLDAILNPPEVEQDW